MSRSTQHSSHGYGPRVESSLNPSNDSPAILSPAEPFPDTGDESVRSSSKPLGGRKTCYSCRAAETTTSPFVRCGCERAWHMACYKPAMKTLLVGSALMYQFDGQGLLYKDFVCKRCKDTHTIKENTATETPTTTESPTTPTEVSAPTSIPNAGPKTCEYPACATMIDFHRLSSSSGLCKKHEIELQFQRAIEAKKNKAPLPVPAEPRLFKKRKLYPLNDEGKAIIKEQRSLGLSKRPRPRPLPTRKRVTFQSERSQTGTEPTEKGMHQPATSTATSTSSTTYTSPSVSRDLSQKQTERANKTFGLSSSLLTGIDNMSTPNISFKTSSTEHSAQIHHTLSSESQQRTEISQENINTNNTLVSPPQIHHNRLLSPAASLESEEDSPDSQLAQEIQAAIPPTGNTLAAKTPGLNLTEASSDEPEEVAMTHVQSIEPAQDLLDDSEDVDESEDDILIDAATLKILPSNSVDSVMADTHIIDVAPVVRSPEPQMAAVVEDIVSMPLPANSLEIVRANKAATFDSSELDSWLAQKPTPPSDFAPSSKELLDSQSWGHIDPRKAWPPVFSEDWVNDKREQIKARGGRKANYGKVISAQNRQEREANGWNIHQSRELKEITEERQEVRQQVNDFFAVGDVDGMVPKFQNGMLFMVDAPETQRKGKRPARMYPVG